MYLAKTHLSNCRSALDSNGAKLIKALEIPMTEYIYSNGFALPQGSFSSFKANLPHKALNFIELS